MMRDESTHDMARGVQRDFLLKYSGREAWDGSKVQTRTTNHIYVHMDAETNIDKGICTYVSTHAKADGLGERHMSRAQSRMCT